MSAAAAKPTEADEEAELLDLMELRELGACMSRGVKTSSYRTKLKTSVYHSVFTGADAIDWLIAHSKCPAKTAAEAKETGQRMLDAGFIHRVARDVFNKGPLASVAVKKAFRGGDSIYRFDKLRISPFRLHVVVRRAAEISSSDGFPRNFYVKLALGGQRAETRICSCVSNPSWDEEFVFGVEDAVASQLRLDIYAYDKIKTDELYGACQVGGLDLLPHFRGQMSKSSMGEDLEDKLEEDAASVDEKSDLWVDSEISSDDGSGPTSSHHRRGSSSLSRAVHKAAHMITRPISVGKSLTGLGRRGNSSPDCEGVASSTGDYQELSGDPQMPCTSTMAFDGETLMWPDVFHPASRVGLSKQANQLRAKLGMEMWLSSFEPGMLKHTGVKQLTVCIKIFGLRNSSSPEERNKISLKVRPSKVRVAMVLGGEEKATSKYRARPSVDGEPYTMSFGGEVMTVSGMINPATDAISVNVHQTAPLDIAEKAIAALKVPISEIPYVEGYEDDVAGDDSSGMGAPRRRDSLSRSVIDNVQPQWYPLQTMAGTFTSRTMKNGEIRMAIWMYSSSVDCDLLGKEVAEDREAPSGTPMELPDPFVNICVNKDLKCGYQRLRRSLLENSSALLAFFNSEQGITERQESGWTDMEGNVANFGNLKDCERSVTYMLPKSIWVAANRVSSKEQMQEDGPEGCWWKVITSTPEVPYGSVFVVLSQYVLIKKGPNLTTLRISTKADFIQRPFIAGQIEGGVEKGTKKNVDSLVEVIENSIAGASLGVKGKRRRPMREASHRNLFIWIFILGTVCSVAAWFFIYGWRPAW